MAKQWIYKNRGNNGNPFVWTHRTRTYCIVHTFMNIIEPNWERHLLGIYNTKTNFTIISRLCWSVVFMCYGIFPKLGHQKYWIWLQWGVWRVRRHWICCTFFQRLEIFLTTHFATIIMNKSKMCICFLRYWPPDGMLPSTTIPQTDQPRNEKIIWKNRCKGHVSFHSVRYIWKDSKFSPQIHTL